MRVLATCSGLSLMLAGLLNLSAQAAAVNADKPLTATLHGRVKDQQCAVLGNMSVSIRAIRQARGAATRMVTTDDGGNYSVALPSGTWEVCIARGTSRPACSNIDMPETGDKWMTIQLRDAAPDLSTLGNHAY